MLSAEPLAKALAWAVEIASQDPTFGDESAARAAWRSEIASVAARIAAIDYGSESETDPDVLERRRRALVENRLDADVYRARVHATRSAPPLPAPTPGERAMLAALQIPREPPQDVGLRNAIDAVRAFFRT